MRAVNLLPPELRAAASQPARRARPEPVQGIGAYVVLGVLAVCVTALAGYVMIGNDVKQREADLAATQQRTAAATARAASLKPYADFEAVASARVETVRGLAAARFDWEQALRDISHAIPADAKLNSLAGDMGLAGSAAGGGDALRGSIASPAITLAGCASSQPGVARLMSRIKAVDGVTRVALSKSEKAAAAGDGAAALGCEGKNPPSYSMVIFFERSAALAAMAPAEDSQPTSVPVPGALTEPAAPAAPEGAAPDADATNSTEPSTTNPDGSTP